MTSILILLLFGLIAKAQVNNTIDSLHIPNISADPVEKKARQQEAVLERDKLYKPNDDNIVSGRSINIDKADLDKYFPNGVDLSLSDTQLKRRLDELKREEIYKYLFIISAILLFGFFAFRYFKNRPKKRDVFLN